MHFGVAQRFAALIAGVRQMSLKLSAKAAAGLPRSVRGMQLCGAGWSRNVGGSCYVPSAARSFAFGELAHIEALVFCVRAARVSNIRTVASDCMTKCRDYEFRVLDPSALFAKKSQKNC